MSRIAVSLQIQDLSGFAKSLREQLSQQAEPPGHVEMLNMLCRSVGFRNYQHCKSVSEAHQRMKTPAAVVAPVDFALVERAVRLFDERGRLLRWPSRPALQELCLWVLWSRLPNRICFTEKQISALIKSWHVFGDHALLRRVDRLASRAANAGWQRISADRTQTARGTAAAAGCDCGRCRR
jgi:hypothetical protein